MSGEDGIGLVNILSRLRLFHSDGVRMRLENRKPHGFEVIVTIPLGGKGDRSNESIDRG